MTDIVQIEGVGDAYAARLAEAGLKTTEELLAEGSTPAGRKAIAEKTGISDSLILKWVNHADLFRINGVARQYAELLEAAGVDTVAELAQRNATNLAERLTEVNTQQNLTNRAPSESEVTRWIDEAKILPRRVTY